MKSQLLDSLYVEFDIANLAFGKIHDKLGDVYEKYCVTILSDKNNLLLAKQHSDCDSLEYKIFCNLFDKYGISDFSNITAITATNKIPLRDTHGLSKTDIIATVFYDNGDKKEFAISCKQSTVRKVAFAEFDADTICREVKITDERLRYLLLKHQTDASAKNFTPNEKKELRELIAPIVREFVRWVVTGSPESDPQNLVYPTSIIKFDLQKPKKSVDIHVENGDFALKSYSVYSVEEYIDSIIYQNGKVKAGGFGTGLSWTYATGSKGIKIQFKA
jgi:hypothetical protein